MEEGLRNERSASRTVKKEHSDTVANRERLPEGCSAARERLLLLCSDEGVGASFGLTRPNSLVISSSAIRLEACHVNINSAMISDLE